MFPEIISHPEINKNKSLHKLPLRVHFFSQRGPVYKKCIWKKTYRPHHDKNIQLPEHSRNWLGINIPPVFKSNSNSASTLNGSLPATYLYPFVGDGQVAVIWRALARTLPKKRKQNYQIKFLFYGYNLSCQPDVLKFFWQL